MYIMLIHGGTSFYNSIQLAPMLPAQLIKFVVAGVYQPDDNIVIASL